MLGNDVVWFLLVAVGIVLGRCHRVPVGNCKEDLVLDGSQNVGME